MDAELDGFRKAKDDSFARDPHSPLTPEQRARFRGLSYFDHDPSLVIAGALEPTDPGEVRMETTGGGVQTYRRAGVVRFVVDGREAAVTLYEAHGAPGYFVPFRDETSGGESYGAGRYLEVEPARAGRVVLDLNYAYNPYCAYNERWTCPLPPTENWLRVPIRAGEKAFGDAHAHAG